MSQPNFGYHVSARFNADMIEVDVESAGMLDDAHQRISIEIIRLKDKVVREALIRLGWSPPPD